MANVPNMPEYHPVLGRLKFDEDLNLYVGAIAAGRHKIVIYCRADRDRDFVKAEDRATRFARDWKVELEASRRFLAGHFLDTANEEWGRPDGDKLAVADFLDRIIATEVMFGGSGEVEYHFADGDLFGGHALIARMRADGILFDAEIAG